MNKFRYYMPTEVYYGENCIEQNAALFSTLGKKALIITMHLPVRHYALEDVEAAMKAQGIEYTISYGAEENPSVESCVAIAKEAAAFAPEFVIAIGGGSAMDTAKSVCFLMNYPDMDPIACLYPKGEERVPLPLVCVPTTSGTGSEVTPFSVLTRNDLNTKMGTFARTYARYAFADAKYIMEMPLGLTRASVIDALAHCMESYVSTANNFMTRALASVCFQLFSEFKDTLVTGEFTKEDREKMMLASLIAGIGFQQTGCNLPHGMGYALTHNKHIPHGMACGMLLGEYLKIFRDPTQPLNAVKMCGFKDLDEFAAFIASMFEVKCEITEEEIVAWSKDFSKVAYRLAKHPEPVGYDEIYTIYKNSIFKK